MVRLDAKYSNLLDMLELKLNMFKLYVYFKLQKAFDSLVTSTQTFDTGEYELAVSSFSTDEGSALKQVLLHIAYKYT